MKYKFLFLLLLIFCFSCSNNADSDSDNQRVPSINGIWLFSSDDLEEFNEGTVVTIVQDENDITLLINDEIFTSGTVNIDYEIIINLPPPESPPLELPIISEETLPDPWAEICDGFISDDENTIDFICAEDSELKAERL